ncbi:MAG: hypothetical protein OIF32_02490 [Campylobacterales bacterium]|nr:hypothetical protein [Campylobacterales bacterium]
MTKTKKFENISHISDTIENDKLQIALSWATSDLVIARLEKYRINPQFFAKHFGLRVIQYFLDVISQKEQIGNCPVVIVLLDFFQKRNISLNDLFIICSGLKNTLINYTYDESVVNINILKELEKVADLNFEGVMIEYTERLQKKTDKKEFFSQPIVVTEVKKEKELETFEEELNEFSLAELTELEEDINNNAILISFGKAETDTVKAISADFKKYGETLATSNLFGNLAAKLIDLANSLLEHQNFIEDEKKKESMTVVVEGLANDLMDWRVSLFEEGIEDPNSLDSSIISSIDTIVSIISGQNVDEDLELF